MLVPIGIGLNKVGNDLLLGYFSDILGVLAALYGGRTVFLSAPFAIHLSSAPTPRAQNAPIPKPPEQDILRPEQPTKYELDTPEKSYFIMLGFLAAYVAIKVTLLYKGIYNFENELLIALMIIGGSSFVYFAYTQFQLDEKYPFLRPLLSKIVIFAVLVISIALYATK